MKNIIYYLDDNLEAQRDLRIQLRALFEPDFEIAELPLEQDFNQYLSHIHDQPIAAIFIDQNLDGSGAISGYTGVKLATYLRSLLPELPLYLITAHPIEGELESEQAGNAEAIIAKTTLLLDSESSRRFRLQFLRDVGRYSDALSANQQRLRELLPRKVRGELQTNELEEYERLKTARDILTEAAEESSTDAVHEKMTEIEELLKKVEQVRSSTQS